MKRIDRLHIPSLSVVQDKDRFCYGIDAVLLSAFACQRLKTSAQQELLGADLGTGNAIIPILMTHEFKNSGKSSFITGIEIQQESAEMARESILLNHMNSQIQVFQQDIKNIQTEMTAGSMDFVVSNPPYMLPARGRQSSNQAKMIARQELLCSLNQVVAGASYLLKEQGSFFMIHRPDRFEEIKISLSENSFSLAQVQFVKPTVEKEPSMVLIHAEKSSDIQTRPVISELVIYGADGEYSQEVKKIYGK